MSGCKVEYVDLGELWRVGIVTADQLARDVEDLNRSHLLALDVQACTGRVRVEGELRRNGETVNAFVEGYIEGQVNDTVAVGKRVVLNVIVVNTTVGRSDDEAFVGVFVVGNGRVVHIDVVSRVQSEVQHIDAVATVGGAEGVIVVARDTVLASTPLVRHVLAGGRCGLEEIGRHHLQDEVHRAVATECTGVDALQLEGSIGARDRVETILRVRLALANGVVKRCLRRCIHGQL